MVSPVALWKKWMKMKEKKKGVGGVGNAHMLLLTMREVGREWKRPMVCKAQNIFFCICYDLKGTYACPEPAVQVIVQVWTSEREEFKQNIFSLVFTQSFLVTK